MHWIPIPEFIGLNSGKAKLKFCTSGFVCSDGRPIMSRFSITWWGSFGVGRFSWFRLQSPDEELRSNTGYFELSLYYIISLQNIVIFHLRL